MAAISPFSDLASLAKALSSKAISVPELTRFFLSRIATDATNSFLAIDPETSLAKAAAAQKRLDSGDTGGQPPPRKGPRPGVLLGGASNWPQGYLRHPGLADDSRLKNPEGLSEPLRRHDRRKT